MPSEDQFMLIESDTDPDPCHLSSIVNCDNEIDDNEIDVRLKFLQEVKEQITFLGQQVREDEMTIQKLKDHIKSLNLKQQDLIHEGNLLKDENDLLHEELNTQREYQSVERYTLLRELCELRSKLKGKSKLLNEAMNNNDELAFALQDANEKIYIMGLKYLKLRSSRLRQSSEIAYLSNSDYDEND